MSPAVDRISSLPKNVIEAVLMHLPLRDAVRTSILSRYWRFEWNTLPQLVFDEKCVSYRGDKGYKSYHKKLVDIVNQVILFHRGPILKFYIAIKLYGYGKRLTDVDRWLTFLGRNGIKEFTLSNEGVSYDVSSCLYLCKELTCLELYYCDITLPASFKGFNSLTTLDLHGVFIGDSDLELLISLCPLLQKLVLKALLGGGRLNICAPKLVELEFEIDFEDVCFENTPLLASLSIELIYDDVNQHFHGTYASVDKLAQFFASLPRIERLDLSDDAFEGFSKGKVPSKFPTACHLKYLSIILNFEDKQEILLAVCIFRSSPMLQDLIIQASPLSELIDHVNIEGFWEAPPDFTYLFSQLRTLKVFRVVGTIYQLKLVESILGNAPVLEKVVIYFKNSGVVPEILKKMINFQRASSKVQFCFP